MQIVILNFKKFPTSNFAFSQKESTEGLLHQGKH